MPRTNRDRGVYKITQDIVPLLMELSTNGGQADVSSLPRHQRLKLIRLGKRAGFIEYRPYLIRIKEFEIINSDFLYPRIRVID